MEDHLTDNDREAFWLELIEELKEEIAELPGYSALPEEEKAFLDRLLDMLLVDGPSFNLRFFFASVMLAGLKLGFLPSECWASIHRAVPCETDFWVGCISYFEFLTKWDRPGWGQPPWEIGKTKETKDFFERALKDASLPRKMRMASLQLKAWCHVALWEFSEALMTLTELKQTIFTSEGRERVDYLMDYIGRLQDHYLGVEEEEEDPGHIRTLGEQTLLVKEQGLLYRHATKFVILPDAEFGEFLPEEIGKAGLLEESLLLPDSVLNAIKPYIDELIKTPILLSLWQAKEEIIGRMPITHTLEQTSQVLLRKYGDWVNKLANQGALVNAEFLYDALKAKSWGGVIIEYSSAVEAEIKARLLPQLENFLTGKGFSLQTILPKRVDRGDSDLGYSEAVLRAAESSLLLKRFLSFLPTETQSFLFHELPNSLAQLRDLRNRAAHGGVMNASEAKQIRKLVLGTPEKAGLLKRLTEINLWKDDTA